MAYSRRTTQKKRNSTSRKLRKPKNQTVKKRSPRTFRKNTDTVRSIEKKIYDSTHPSLSFAQYRGAANLTGHTSITPSPAPALGLTASDRIGNKIFVTGCRMDMEILGQANQSSTFRYRWYLIRVPDCTSILSSDDLTQEFLDQNPFAPVYDWHSPRDMEMGSSYKVVATGTGKLESDNIAGQVAHSQIRKYLKINQAIKFENLSPYAMVQNQFRMILLGDSGNHDAAYLTGAAANINFRWFYTDN